MKRIGWLACTLIIVPPLTGATNIHLLVKLASECRAGKAESCQKLGQIARTDKECRQRITAAGMLPDQAALADIATGPAGESCNGQVGMAAISGLTDQNLLARIVRENIHNDARLAVRHLTDQHLLAEIARSGDGKGDLNRDIRSLAVNKLTDQTALAGVARNADDPYIRAVALSKVTDQTALADLARNASGGNERLLAAGRLADKGMAQSVYAEMAKTAGSTALAVSAVGRLTSQDLLADVAKTAPDGGVREAASARLRDLSEVAKAEVRPGSGGPNPPPAAAPLNDPLEISSVSATYRQVSCQLSRFNVVYSASGWGLTVTVHNPTDAEVTAEVNPGLQMIDTDGKPHAIPEGFWSSSACTNRGVNWESTGSFYIMSNGFALEYTKPAGGAELKVGSLTGIWDGQAQRGRAILSLLPQQSVKVLFLFEGPPESKPKSLVWPGKPPVATPMN